MAENISIGAIIFIVIWGFSLVAYVIYLNVFGHGYTNIRRLKNVFRRKKVTKNTR